MRKDTISPITDWRIRLSLRSVHLPWTIQHGVTRVAPHEVLKRLRRTRRYRPRLVTGPNPQSTRQTATGAALGARDVVMAAQPMWCGVVAWSGRWGDTYATVRRKPNWPRAPVRLSRRELRGVFGTRACGQGPCGAASPKAQPLSQRRRNCLSRPRVRRSRYHRRATGHSMSR